MADGIPVSFQFDLGRRFPDLDLIIHPALEVSGIEPSLVSHGYSSVLGTVALQAVDLVAHETYQFFTKYIDDENATPSAHLRRLIEDSHDVHNRWMGKKEILEMVDEMRTALKQIDPSWAS